MTRKENAKNKKEKKSILRFIDEKKKILDYCIHLKFLFVSISLNKVCSYYRFKVCYLMSYYKIFVILKIRNFQQKFV